MAIMPVFRHFRDVTLRVTPLKETLENIKDAAKLHLDDMTESGQEIPKSSQIFLTTIEIRDSVTNKN